MVPLTCYMEPTRDNLSNTVYRQFEVFISAGWDYTQVFRIQRQHQVFKVGTFEDKIHNLESHLAAVTGEGCTSRQLKRS